MKRFTSLAIGLLFFSANICFAHPPECGPGPHGCDNKLLKSPVLKIHPFKLVDKTGKAHLLVDKHGNIESEGKTVGTISKDGKVVDPNGKLLAMLRETSVLEDSTGAPLVRISPDGTIDNGSGVNIRWTKKGNLKRGNSLLDVRLVSTHPSTRRAASIVYFLNSHIQSPKIEELPSQNK